MNLPAELLAHDQWLRPMVRSLVAAHDVDDVLQDTWLAALRRPPGRGPRQWLSRVARNFAHLQRRRDARRRGREACAAGPEATLSTAETVQKLALQAKVAKAVAELAEPYREAVILRFHDGLGYGAIAARHGISVDNARQRVSRGLARLRLRLSEEDGEGWERCCAVALLIRSAPRPLLPLGTGLVGVWIMKKSIGVAVAVLVVLSTLVLAVGPFSFGSGVPEADPLAAPMSSAAGAVETAVRADAAPPPRRTPVVEEREGAAGPSFRGLVLDTAARPVSGVEVVAAVIPEAVFQRIEETGELGDFVPVFRPIGVSDAEGRFSIAPDGRLGRIRVSPPWAMLRGPDELPDWEREDEILVIVSPSASVGGIVSDEAGIPLAGVLIEVRVPDLVDFSLPLDPTTRAGFDGTETGADGRFALAGLPGGHCSLSFYKPGYHRATLEVGAGALPGEAVVLRALEEGRFTLVGTVSDPRGRPVDRARVGVGEVFARTDRSGRYRLDLDDEALGRTRPLYAVKPGMQTWVRGDPRSLFSGASEVELDIRLQGDALELAGRVVDPDGTSLSAVHVYLWKEAALVGGQSAEDLALGDEVSASRRGRPRVRALTGADGSFLLEGLRDKDYLLRLRDDATWLAWTEGPFRAGRRDLELTAPVEAILPELRGRVVGRDGLPVEGARVTFSVQVVDTPPSDSWSGPDEDAAFSDAEGRFRFADVPIADRVLLVASGEDMVVHLRYFSPEELRGEVVLEVDRRCNFRVELTRPGVFSRIQLLDGRGEMVRIWEHSGRSNTSHRTFALTEGRTPVVSAGEQARTLVFLGSDGEVLERMPIRLVPGQVNLIQR